eukprot:jgi/Botrbrau1/1214/Bobra.0163s0022.1
MGQKISCLHANALEDLPSLKLPDDSLTAGEPTFVKKGIRPRTVATARAIPRSVSEDALDDTAKRKFKTPFTPSDGAESGTEVLQREDSAHVDELLVDPVEPIFRPIPDAESAMIPALGGPHRPINLGPPKPPCQEDRLATLRQLHLDEPDLLPDPSIGPIVELMCKVFHTENALVAILEGERVFIREATGMFHRGDFPWRWSFCGWSLASHCHQDLIIQDAHNDARFVDNKFVKSEDVRFYAGTPLVASNGQRLGTLCFADPRPRTFDAGQCQIMHNMAELVVREIERGWALSLAVRDRQKFEKEACLRAMDCFTDPVLMVDTGKPGWQLLHVNTAFEERLGVTRQDALSQSFWQLFKAVQYGETPWQVYRDLAARGVPFEVKGMQLAESHSPDTAILYKFTFRSASRDRLDHSAIAVGSPSYVQFSPTIKDDLYFVTCHAVAAEDDELLFRSSSLPMDQTPPFQGLTLGPLLGRGGFGSVFRGFLDGDRVAVKIVEDPKKVKWRGNEPVEYAVTSNVKHPNILRTLAFKSVCSLGKEKEERTRHDSASSYMGDIQLWMLLEFCNRGSLMDAIDKGWLRCKKSQIEGEPCFKTIVETAFQIASAMEHLHNHGVIHGDLTGGNVLLTDDPTAAHGWMAKVADFGMAREVNVAACIKTRTYGTVTHMPPELLREGSLSTAADMYAFGIIMWEMFNGCRAWASMTHAQVITAVAIEGRGLRFGRHKSEPYAQLAMQCMKHHATERPTFPEIVRQLAVLRTTCFVEPPPAA